MDSVDRVIEQWQNEGFKYDDLMAMECIGRIKRTEMLLIKKLEINYKDKYGIATWAFDVLATLRRSGKPYRLSPTELFASMMVSSGAMTNRLNQLEKKDLITRIENIEDGRSLLVQLTDTGLMLINSAIVEHIKLENKLLANFSETEVNALSGLLKKLELNLAE